MGAMASQITSLTIVYSTVYSVNFPHKWPVTRKTFPFDDLMHLSAHSQTSTKRNTVWAVLNSFRTSYPQVINIRCICVSWFKMVLRRQWKINMYRECTCDLNHHLSTYFISSYEINNPSMPHLRNTEISHIFIILSQWCNEIWHNRPLYHWFILLLLGWCILCTIASTLLFSCKILDMLTQYE